MTKVKKISATCCWVVVGLTLSSCELLGPRQAARLPLPPVKVEPVEDLSKSQKKVPPIEKPRAKSELFPGTGQFVPSSPESHRKTKGSGEGAYSLNFDEADLGEVAKVVLSDILGQNYVLSPKVTGKVTLQTTDPLSKDELIPTLEMLLRMNNAVLIKDASIYHIEPASEALYSSNFAAPGVAGKTGYQVRVIPIRNVAVSDLMEVLKPLVQEKTILTTDSTRNILVASGTPDELARVMDMVSTFDIDVLKGRSFGLYPLAHTEPETIIKELEEVFSSKSKDDDSAFFRFLPIERMNAIMAITHQSRYLQDIESWILRLDKANTASGGGVNVYKVQNTNAEDLADTLNGIFTGSSSSGSTAKVAPGKKATEVTNKPTDPNQAAGGAGGGSTSSTSSKKKSGSKSGGGAATGTATVADIDNVKIISDRGNNSLIIVATPREYDIVLPIIKQLDILPLQVLIDASVVSVKLTDNLKYGIQWFLDHGESSISSGSTGATLGQIATAGGAAFATGGLSAVYNSGVVNAILSAQAGKGNVNVISSPSLMVLNNQDAKINVGQQVPVSTGGSSIPISGTTTGASFAQTNSIQYKDTGVTLDVTPRVNANGMVIMDIKQIVSSVVSLPSSGTTLTQQQTPTIDKKEIESSVAVQDGETIVLGGLIDEQNTESKGGIPFLHELPWIGPIFGSTLYDKTKNELVVLITPRVVKTKQDSREISDEFKRKLTGIYETRAVVSPASAVK